MPGSGLPRIALFGAPFRTQTAFHVNGVADAVEGLTELTCRVGVPRYEGEHDNEKWQ